jgi:hypothetical protein
VARPPVVEVRDQTARTIGIIALVVGGLAFLAQVVMLVFPLLMLGGLIWGTDEGWVEEGPVPMSTLGFTGHVAPASDGAVSAAALAAALADHGDQFGGVVDRPASQIQCDPVARVTPDTSTLCRGSGGDRWYAVVRFTDRGGSFAATVLEDFEEAW